MKLQILNKKMMINLWVLSLIYPSFGVKLSNRRFDMASCKKNTINLVRKPTSGQRKSNFSSKESNNQRQLSNCIPIVLVFNLFKRRTETKSTLSITFLAATPYNIHCWDGSCWSAFAGSQDCFYYDGESAVQLHWKAYQSGTTFVMELKTCLLIGHWTFGAFCEFSSACSRQSGRNKVLKEGGSSYS